jgi:hypothetical protein
MAGLARRSSSLGIWLRNVGRSTDSRRGAAYCDVCSLPAQGKQALNATLVEMVLLMVRGGHTATVPALYSSSLSTGKTTLRAQQAISGYSIEIVYIKG